MANRFDVATPQKYVNTYVPLPLDAIGALAKDFNDKYTFGQNMVGELDVFSQQLKNAPMDQNLKDSWVKDARMNLNALVEEGQRNHSFANPEFQNKIKNTINILKSDPRVNTILLNKQFYDKWSADKAKCSGGNCNDLDFTFEYDPQHPTGFKQNTGKVYSQSKITPYEASYDTQSKIMSGISPDGYSVDGGYDFTKPGTEFDVESDTYKVYNKTTHKWEGLTRDKVENIAKTSVNLYGNTGAGKYDLQQTLQKYLGSDVYNLNWERLNSLAQQGNSDAQQYVNYFNKKWQNELFSVAIKQIGGKSSVSVDTKEFKMPDNVVATGDAQQIILPGDPNASNVSFYNPNAKTENKIIAYQGAVPGNLPLASSTGLTTSYNKYSSKNINDIIQNDPVAAKYINTSLKLTGKKIDELTPDEQYRVLEAADKIAKYASQPQETSTATHNLTSYDEQVLKAITGQTSDKINTVKDLTNWTGNIYQKDENGNLVKINKAVLADESLVKINKFDPQNPFYFKNNSDPGLKSPFEFKIDGVSYIASNPNYTFESKSGTQSRSSEKANNLQLQDNIINEIHSLSLYDPDRQPMRIESITIPGSGKSYDVLYLPPELDQNDKTGGYLIKELNIKVRTAQETFRAIVEDLGKK